MQVAGPPALIALCRGGRDTAQARRSKRDSRRSKWDSRHSKRDTHTQTHTHRHTGTHTETRTQTHAHTGTHVSMRYGFPQSVVYCALQVETHGLSEGRERCWTCVRTCGRRGAALLYIAPPRGRAAIYRRYCPAQLID